MEEQEILDQPHEVVNNKQRPTAITVICVLGFIGSAFTIPMIFSDIAELIGEWYPPYLGLSAGIGLFSMIGLWKMKKWAAYTYTGLVVINQFVLFTMGVWSIMALLIPAIVVGIALYHVNKMD